MFVRPLLAFAVALHRAAAALRIAATKADTAATARRLELAAQQHYVARAGITAAEEFASQCRDAAYAAGAEYNEACHKNNHTIDRLRAAL